MNNVRKLRHNLNMTQSAFAEYCDVSIISISRYEAGESISRRNAEKIAHACHVSQVSCFLCDVVAHRCFIYP